MTPDDKTEATEREATDESLRLERERVDRALAENLAATDETADAVIGRARARADDVLAVARAKIDRQHAASPPSRQVERQRRGEDSVVQNERANADDLLMVERAEQRALLAKEREETDKDLLRERTRADAAVQMRDEFLGIVSHDLRNLLDVILRAASLITADLAQPSEAASLRSNAVRIQRAGGRMNRLIGDLVDVASIDAGALAVSREPGDPSHIVAEAVETFQAAAVASGLLLTAAPVPPGTTATFDSARILQVLTNLLSNAIKFTPAGGKVLVRIERLGDELRFAVADTGVGIPKDKLEAVFERFLQINRNDRRGVGLGLYISKCIVQGHGGKIWAESVVGVGTTFYFTLPSAAAG